jgi:hypothetical protein
MKIGDKYKCIKSFKITGRPELFTKGLIYKCEHNNCLTANGNTKYTIVWPPSDVFNFDNHFKIEI